MVNRKPLLLVAAAIVLLVVSYILYSRHRTRKARFNRAVQAQKAPPVYEPGLMPKRPASPMPNASADIQRTMRTIEEINRINKMNAEMRQRQPVPPRK
ncbi:MAG: hypothetical protein WC859_07185 [Elusimicrobiota bacterium]|jgi:hypothetical protein